MPIPPSRNVGDPGHTTDHNNIRQELIDLNTEVDGKAASTHTHAGTDIASGTVPAARLGSGSSITTKFLRGDNTWQPITAADIPHVHDADDVTAGVFPVDRLGTGSASSLTFLRGDGTWATPPSGGSGAPGSHAILVAASNAPAAIRARADYVCTGANDHVQINAALTTAANQLGGNGTRQSSVVLSDGDYSLGAPVLIPNRGLAFGGTSKLTRLFRGAAASNFTGGSGTTPALIKFANTEEARSAVFIKIHTMTLDGLGQATGCSGIYLDMAGQTASYSTTTYGQPDASPDHNILIEGISTIYTPYGIYVKGNGDSEPRVTKILNCISRNFGVIGIGGDSSSDAKVVSCTTQGGQSNNAIGFQALGGNCEFVACKAAYASTGGATGGIGFNINSSRALLSACVSQDNPFAINVNNQDCMITGLKIDSQIAATRGVFIGADRCVATGLQITVRNSGTISRALEFSSATHDHFVEAYIQGSTDIAKKVNINNGAEITDQANLPRGLYRIRVSGDPGTSLVR